LEAQTLLISSDTNGLQRLKYQIKESRCTIISNKLEALFVAQSSIESHRLRLEKYIRVNPDFKISLNPIHVDGNFIVVKLMAEAARQAGVGPMAAVAGVLADLAVQEMLGTGAKVAIVENGGESYIVSDRPIDIAIQAGDTPLSRHVGFRLEKFPIGVATSSGIFSHALSFGKAEAATIFAENAGIADAAATAVANAVKGEDEKRVIKKAVELGLSINGVQGVFIIYRGHVGLGGKIPPIISVNPEEKIINQGDMIHFLPQDKPMRKIIL
jgi:ApbE superfamily uncharacterized protein (UPF0280 family)